MNQMDENYWKQLAQDWIKRQQNGQAPSIQNAPEAPKISETNYDNMAVADMDIEDESAQNQNWNSICDPAVFSNIQSQQFLQSPVQKQFPVSSSRFQKNDQPRRNFILQEPLVIPEAPLINSIEDQINAVDMDMNTDSENDSNSTSSFNMMEMQKRQKKLPVWIREGLEKMKREKELEEARIQDEKRRKSDEENRKKLMEEALKEIEKEKVSKSKYESSDSETEETEPIQAPQIKHKYESIENDEEAYEKMMLLVRKTLTSLLLEVTDEIIQEISTETLSKYHKKASATTKPAIIKLGLGEYTSSTDEEDSGDENGGSDSESESILKERIYQKQLSFEKRMREKHEKQQSDDETEHMRQFKRSEISDDKQKFNKNTRKDGEEKYETMIYSISTSSGPIPRVPREKKTRFSDPKDGRSTTQMTHLGMVESSRSGTDNGTSSSTKIAVPTANNVLETPATSETLKKEKKKKRSSSASSSNDSGQRKKHKKHKKSSKHSKKSSKKRDRSRSRSKSRDTDKRHHSSRSDRRSIESKCSIRSSESNRHRSRSSSHRRRY